MQRKFAKPSHLIHIEHKYSLLQAQILDFILARTLSENVATQTEYQVPLASVVLYIGKTRNYPHIQAALARLGDLTTSMMLWQEHTFSKQFNIFQVISFNDRMIAYSLKKPLNEIIAYSSTCTKIDLTMNLKFKSQYAFWLYQLALDYRTRGHTPWMSCDNFRRYMGIAAHQYLPFSTLNFSVIKSAVAHVNRVSDIQVQVEYHKEYRKVQALRFSVKSARKS